MKYFLTGLTVLLIASNAQAVGWDETNSNPPGTATVMIQNLDQPDPANQTEYTALEHLPVSNDAAFALEGKVSKTGNEALSGIKDFLDSPTVPTPTVSGQAANKGYVDQNAGVPEAPNDGEYYSRRNQAWAVNPGEVGEAPVDGTPYSRQDAGWVPAATGGGDGNVTGPTSSVTNAIATYADTTGGEIVDHSGCTVFNGVLDCAVPDGAAYLDIVNSGSITATPLAGRLTVGGGNLYIGNGSSWVPVSAGANPTNLQISLDSDNLSGETDPTNDNIWISPKILNFNDIFVECDGTTTGMVMTIGYNASSSYGAWSNLGTITDFSGAVIDISTYTAMAEGGRVALWISTPSTGAATSCSGRMDLTP